MIKTIIQNIKPPQLGTLLLLTLLANTLDSTGQEFIKRPKLGCDTSLVREVSTNEWITCSYYNLHSTFTLINESNTTAPTISLPAFYFVSDFEIYNDTVYFCGYVDSGSTVALFGYLDLAAFPYSTVYCNLNPFLFGYNKLVVFNDDNKPHIVFTGAMKYRSILADAILSAPNTWDFAYAYLMDNQYLVYDDVAATEEYIVATSRLEFLDSGLIHYFHKPSNYHTIFPLFQIYRSVQYHTVSQILITACSGNYFATVCKNTPSSFVTSRYNCFNDNYSMESPLYVGECRDINFNCGNDQIEVLLFSIGQKYPSSFTIHYDNIMPSSTNLPAHDFEMHSLHSIDYLYQKPQCFIASGYQVGEPTLRIYKYIYNEWHNCTKESNIAAKKIGNNNNSFYNPYKTMLNTEEALKIECSLDTIIVETLCED